MTKVQAPSRKPDIIVGGLSFWFEERIQTNRWLEDIYEVVDFIKWRYRAISKPNCSSYSYELLLGEELDKVKRAYADWLMEKNFFS